MNVEYLIAGVLLMAAGLLQIYVRRDTNARREALAQAEREMRGEDAEPSAMDEAEDHSPRGRGELLSGRTLPREAQGPMGVRAVWVHVLGYIALAAGVVVLVLGLLGRQ